MRTYYLLLYGVHGLIFSFICYLAQILSFIINFQTAEAILTKLTYFSFFISIALVMIDLLSLFFSPSAKTLKFSPVKNLNISVGMTAYNDELSIKKAAEDFINQENVCKVVVVDNNSTDKTAEEARKAGATVIKEEIQGYGACCIKALREAMKYGDIICLVEGDCTFSGSDLKKFTAYLENADMVVGTRTTKELNTPDSQMNFLLQWGNVLMAKLVQLKFWSVRLTDMGCTYRIIRRDALEKIIDKLEVKGNHFLCEMILVALKNNLMVIEIPITLKKRVGQSKGVGNNFIKAAITAIDMWKLIISR
ncbi:MAG: glycosyltransferase family 2 protein [bacterium]